MKGNNELYSGYSKVSNDYIDTSKIQTYLYSTATPNTLTTNYTRANGEENVTVSVKIDNPNEWRTNPQISSDKTENVATITSKLGDGGVRVETYYGVDVSGKDLKINNEDLFGLSYEWFDTDAKGIVRGEVEFQSGSTVVLKEVKIE